MENKKLNYKRIITIFLVLLVWAGILLVFVDSKPMYGKWNCGEDKIIEFHMTRSFEIYNAKDEDEIYVEGSFKAKRQKVGLPKIKYDVTLQSDDESQSDYFKDILVSLNQKRLNEMIITDKESKIEYKCKRSK